MRIFGPISIAEAALWFALVVSGAMFDLSFAQTAKKRVADKSRVPTTPTFYRDVLPIVQKHCEMCHRSEGIAPMAFEIYENVRRYAAVIRNVTTDKAMPPSFAIPLVGRFSNDPALTAEQIDTLASWANAKAPAGDPLDAPVPLRNYAGWSIPQPDVVVQMPRPVSLPPDGDLEYTYEIIPTHFTKDHWVQMAEVLPSSRANVQQAVVFIRPPDSQWLRHSPVGEPFTAADLASQENRSHSCWTDNDILVVYSSASSTDNWPATMAKLVPAGSDLVFLMHYTTNGHVGADQTRVGLVFSKQPPPLRVLTLQLTNDRFVIPPEAPDYRVEARGVLPKDVLLLSFFPHMHLRGERFEYNITHIQHKSNNKREPTVETLLRVNYDLRWQRSYRLAVPRPLKAGTELQAVAWYNNSGINSHNPDSTAFVHWGVLSSDEMMVGFFEVLVPAGLNKRRYFIQH